MPLFTWNASYSVNVKRFDADHQQLFNILNELHEGMKTGRGKEVLEGTLTELLRYTERHFTGEEAVLRELGYAELAAHIEQHRRFTDKIKQVSGDYRSGKIGLSVDVLDFLTKWLSQHIVGIDKRYSTFVNAKGVA